MYVGTIIKKKKIILMVSMQVSHEAATVDQTDDKSKKCFPFGKAEVFLGLLNVAFTLMSWCIKLYQYIIMFFIQILGILRLHKYILYIPICISM